MQPYPRSPDLVWPGHLHGTGCLSARAVSTGFPTVVRRLCLGPVRGWVRVFLSPPVLAGSWVGVFGHGLWCSPSSVGCLWCSWLGFGVGLLMGRVWFRGRPACPPAFSNSGVRCGCVCWARVSAVRSPSWLGCRGVFFALFFSFLFSCPGPCGPCPPIPFLSGWTAGSLFFFFAVPFPGRPLFLAWCCRFWVGGPPVPLGGSCLRCLLGGGFSRLWWCSRAVWRLWAVFAPFPPPPSFFFWGGGCLFLPLPSLGWCTHWPALSVVFRAAVFSCVLFGRAPAAWVGWAMHTVGSAPLLAGLGPGSAGWAAAPGSCLWFWVRGLGLFVSLPLCGAGCNLLGGPPPLLPGALWPRVWPAVLVCGVLVWRLPGCAVAGFG